MFSTPMSNKNEYLDRVTPYFIELNQCRAMRFELVDVVDNEIVSTIQLNLSRVE